MARTRRPRKTENNAESKPEHEVWLERINRSLKLREEWETQFRVGVARDFFEGKQNPGWPVNEWITVNKIYTHLKAALPHLYSVDPYFYVKLAKHHGVDAEKIAVAEIRGEVRQSMLNYLKGELDLKTTARLAIQDAHFAYGVLKTRFDGDREENPSADQPMLADSGEPLTDEKGEPILEPEWLITNEKYVWDRVHPRDFLWDEDAGPLETSWNWVAQRSTLLEKDARADPDLDNEAVKTATVTTDRASSAKLGAFKRAMSKPGGDGERQIIVMWEIYDLQSGEWLRVLEGADRLGMKPRSTPPGVEKHPYSVLRFTLRDDSPYPIPPLSQGIDLQLEYNIARSSVMRHRKRFNRKYEVVVAGLEDEAELDKLESGEDGTMIRVLRSGSVQPILDAPLDQMQYQEIGHLTRDIAESLGSTDNSRGIATADSATEAQIVDSRMEAREGDALSLVVDWITHSARRMDQLVQATITEDLAVRVAGPRGEAWHEVRVEDYEEIAGEFAYSVNTGSTMPRLPNIERAQWMAFIQVLTGFPQLMTRPRFMKHMAEMHHIEDEVMLEELAELGKQIMQAQGPAPGGQGGSAPAAGVPTENPITQVLGAAGGPGGGSVNGGGGMQ